MMIARLCSIIVLFLLFICRGGCLVRYRSLGKHFIARKYGVSNVLPRSPIMMAKSNDIESSRPSQVLEFIEPTTDTNVVLIGAMHYNPSSIALTRDTIRSLAEKDELGAIIIESCPIRWNRTVEFLDNVSYAVMDQENTKPLLRSVLYNEMLAAVEMGRMYNIPVILGDQLINVTNSRMKEAFISSVQDIASPLKGGWRRLYADIKQAFLSSSPWGPGYLNAQDFFNFKLLLLTPVTLVKYPLALMIRAPVALLPVLLVVLANYFSSQDSASLLDDASTTGMYSSTSNDAYAVILAQLQDFANTLGVCLVEVGVLGRVFLVSILSERNVVLAQSILKQCARLSPAQPSTTPVVQPWWRRISPLLAPLTTSSSSSSSSSSATSPSTSEKPKKKKVVAVLGMAHCNGIKQLLVSQQVETS